MSLDYDREMVTMGPDKSKSFALPDGAILTVTQPQVQVPELLVNPSVGTPELWKAVGLAGPPPSLQVRVCVRRNSRSSDCGMSRSDL